MTFHWVLEKCVSTFSLFASTITQEALQEKHSESMNIKLQIHKHFQKNLKKAPTALPTIARNGSVDFTASP